MRRKSKWHLCSSNSLSYSEQYLISLSYGAINPVPMCRHTVVCVTVLSNTKLKQRPLKIYLGICSTHLSPPRQNVQECRRNAGTDTFEYLLLRAIYPVRYTDSW